MGGYWLTLGITGTYNDCSREVINFVRTYVDEIRKIVPDDKPIYIELQEKTEKIVLLTEPTNTSNIIMTMTILVVAAVSILTILMWRSIRRVRTT
jgi:preprotein translocase subunit SecE